MMLKMTKDENYTNIICLQACITCQSLSVA